MSLAALLESVIQILDECNIPSMLTGSLAATYYAVPRATQDIDIVVDAKPEQIRALVDRLQERGLYVSETAAEEALGMRGQFNVIDPVLGWKVDLIIRKDRAFSALEFSRRRVGSVLGVRVALTSLEDLILAKLEWSQMGDSDQQRQDILHLLQSGWGSLDDEYLREWARQLGLANEWQRIIDQIGDEHGRP